MEKKKKKKKTDVLTNDLEKLLLMEKISNYFKYKKKNLLSINNKLHQR